MTILNVLQGIVNALYEYFGSGYTFYLDKVNQSLTEPCFLIKCLDPAQNVDLGIRYKRTHQFSVQYFPAVQDSYEECNRVTDGLFCCLGDIVVSENILHGKNLQGEMTDGILTFTVNYDLFLLKNEEAEPDMVGLSVDVDIE